MSFVVDRYYRAEVEGIEHMTEGRALVTATHNGGVFMPDLWALMVAFWRRFGLETPAYGLMHTFAFPIPGLGDLLSAAGAVPATRENAATVLDAGFPLMVCPGGDLDALKPYRERHRITFGKRRGFIRTALKHSAPIVPVVSVGAHEVFVMLNDGRRTAELFGFARFLRIKTVPLALGFPFGLNPAGIFSLPLPTKVRVRVLPRIELGEPPEAADDPIIVERCFERVRATMQDALDDLASTRRRFVLG